MAWRRRWVREARQREAELAAELEEHIQQRAAQYEAQGLSPAEALRRARIQFGSVPAIQEEIRALGPWEFLASWLRDLRFTLRSLRRDRAFTLAVILSLAVGLGASTAMYSVLYGVLLQPLPFAHAERIYRIYEAETETEHPPEAVAVYWGALRAFSEQARSVEAITAVSPIGARIDWGDGRHQRIWGARVDPFFFRVFPARPALGRLPHPDTWYGPDRDTVLLSFDLWTSEFGGDPAVLGKSLRIKGFGSVPDQNLRIIGVLPPDFRFPTARLKDTRFVATSHEDWLHPSAEDLQFGWRSMDTFVLASPSASVASLRAELRAVFTGLHEQNPRLPKRKLAIVPMPASYAENDRVPLQLLFGAALALTLLCCLNVANLMVARALKSAPEIGLRKALGGSHAALLRGIACQAAVLALGGLAGAVVVAAGIAGTLQRYLPAQIPYAERIGFPLEVVAFLVACGLVVVLLASALLAWYTLRAPALGQISNPGGRIIAGAGVRVRHILLSAQVAASLLLLCGAALLLANLHRTVSQDFGFAWKEIAAVHLILDPRDVGKETRTAALKTLGEELGASFGRNQWAIADGLPVGNSYGGSIVFRQDGSRSDPRNFVNRMVGPEYFGFLGIPIVAGRPFSDADRAGTAPVAIVSRRWARLMLGTDEPVGVRFRLSGRPDEPWITVVGLAPDVRTHTNFREEVPAVYRPLAQVNPPFGSILLRTRAPVEQIEAAVRGAIERAGLKNSELLIGRASDAVWAALEQSRFYSAAIGAFAVVALLLAAIGVYGVLQYLVVQRRRELGVRAAVGASRGDLQWLIVRQAALPVLCGALAGLAIAAWASRYLESLLHTIQPLSPHPYILAAAALALAAFVAAIAPARQAASANPVDCLRAE